MNDREWMQEALALAAKAAGRTSPNPVVGAIIVKDGRRIGAGFHRKAGGPHAEIEALRDCNESTSGATAYVTLEPCCHFGKTPPCSQALIDAGITRVVYASPDTNPLVDGGGHRQLEAAGIQVEGGLLAAEGNHLNRAFFHYIRVKRPYVTAKIAMSLDGKIATRTGESQWISSQESRHLAHQLRDYADAVMVGTGTALADNPRLTVRLPHKADVCHPKRIVLDAKARIPLDFHVFDPSLPASTTVVTAPDVPEAWHQSLVERGVDVMTVPHGPGGLDLDRVLVNLAKNGIVNLMVEGGGKLLGQLLMAGLIQEVWAFICPRLIGGEGAPSPFAGEGFGRLLEAPQLDIFDVQASGPDQLIRARVITDQQSSLEG